MAVAEAAIAAAGKHHPFPGFGQIGDQGLAVLIEDLRSRRHLEHDIGATGTGAVLAHAIAALLGLEVLLVAVVE